MHPLQVEAWTESLPFFRWYFNSLAPGTCGSIFLKVVILKLIIHNSGLGIHSPIALSWMPQNLTDNKSTLVQVMAWCRQATSHYLHQCWPSYLSPYDVIRPQWVKVFFFNYEGYCILLEIALKFVSQDPIDSLHWFRQCLGAKQAPRHYPNQWWWPSLVMQCWF